MDRLARHEHIIDTEYYLYGGIVDVPKIYDADSKHHSERYVKGSTRAAGTRVEEKPRRVVDSIDFDNCSWLDRLIVNE
jgi:hypothetical protein